MFFRWPTRVNGKNKSSIAGSYKLLRKAEKLAAYKMDYFLALRYTKVSIIILFQSILTYVYSIYLPFFKLITIQDDYKVICFFPSAIGEAGRRLSQKFLDDPLRPPDSLLRWHLRQAVLTNMKGAGEPTFEHDFPPGSDIMGDIRDGPRAAERMEYEIFGRLAVHMEIC